MDITKARVLETFMKHYRLHEGQEDRRRALMASNDTQDELVPWRNEMPPDECDRRHTVTEYVHEILDQDYGIKVVAGRKYTPREIEGTNAGGLAAIEWLKTNAGQIPRLGESWEDRRAWMGKVNTLAFELVPALLSADKEWTYGFIAGFTGDLHRYLHGQALIGNSNQGSPS